MMMPQAAIFVVRSVERLSASELLTLDAVRAHEHTLPPPTTSAVVAAVASGCASANPSFAHAGGTDGECSSWRDGGHAEVCGGGQPQPEPEPEPTGSQAVLGRIRVPKKLCAPAPRRSVSRDLVWPYRCSLVLSRYRGPACLVARAWGGSAGRPLCLSA
jgi:hypothetical protein